MSDCCMIWSIPKHGSQLVVINRCVVSYPHGMAEAFQPDVQAYKSSRSPRTSRRPARNTWCSYDMNENHVHCKSTHTFLHPVTSIYSILFSYSTTSCKYKDNLLIFYITAYNSSHSSFVWPWLYNRKYAYYMCNNSINMQYLC